eukprot:5672038-Pyramimonas_sp.AAC.1
MRRRTRKRWGGGGGNEDEEGEEEDWKVFSRKIFAEDLRAEASAGSLLGLVGGLWACPEILWGCLGGNIRLLWRFSG